MKLNHTFRHLDISESLIQYCQQQIEEVSRFLLKDGHGHVYYSKANHEFCVEIAVNTRRRYFKATASHVDIYAAVDEVMTKLERQILKTHKAVKNHKRPELSRSGRLHQLNGQLEFAPRLKKAA
jgi:ribosomal subunit interface protein